MSRHAQPLKNERVHASVGSAQGTQQKPPVVEKPLLGRHSWPEPVFRVEQVDCALRAQHNVVCVQVSMHLASPVEGLHRFEGCSRVSSIR